ncbi:MAG: hypothetical protein WA830_25895, partial [Candidatus Sulfotelmatobacter sp.]
IERRETVAEKLIVSPLYQANARLGRWATSGPRRVTTEAAPLSRNLARPMHAVIFECYEVGVPFDRGATGTTGGSGG